MVCNLIAHWNLNVNFGLSTWSWAAYCMLLVVFHRAIVRHVLIGQCDRKFVNDSLCNALLFLRCSLLFHTSRLVSSRLVSSWPCVEFTEVNSSHESTGHVVNSTHVSSWLRVQLTQPKEVNEIHSRKFWLISAILASSSIADNCYLTAVYFMSSAIRLQQKLIIVLCITSVYAHDFKVLLYLCIIWYDSLMETYW